MGSSRKWGLTLPQSYVEFLLEINGGYPSTCYYRDGDWSTVVQEFCPLLSYEGMRKNPFSVEIKNGFVAAEDVQYDNYLPPGYLKVGSFINGDPIALCIDLENEHCGSVLNQEHEMETGEFNLLKNVPERFIKKRMKTLTILCRDFGEFINSLEEPEE